MKCFFKKMKHTSTKSLLTKNNLKVIHYYRPYWVSLIKGLRPMVELCFCHWFFGHKSQLGSDSRW